MNELSHPLSAREKEVVMLIASGFSCRKVASKLGITFNTARAHRYNAMLKMKVNNVSSLLHAAIRLGLIAADIKAARLPLASRIDESGYGLHVP